MIVPLFSISITFCVVGVLPRSVPNVSAVGTPKEFIFLDNPTIPTPPSVALVFPDIWISPSFTSLLPFTPYTPTPLFTMISPVALLFICP